LYFLAPDSVSDEKLLLEKGVDQVSGFGIGPTQQFDGDGCLLGSVATLKPMFQRLQFFDGEFTRRLRRHHHGITTTNDDSASQSTTTTKIQQTTNKHGTSITTPSVLLTFFLSTFRRLLFFGIF
jgi:hypothetical protein